MTQRRHHYEVAFEQYLRNNRIPYVAVNEARKAILPDAVPLRAHGFVTGEADDARGLKSFDMVVYGQGTNLLVEVKGRRVGRPRKSAKAAAASVGPPMFEAFPPRKPMRAPSLPRLESWVTRDDVESLAAWQKLFGPEFEAAFIFVYWCEDQPPDGLFAEVFEHQGRWYSLRAALLNDYARAMKTRSPRWGTVHVPPTAFERISRPFAPRRDFDADPLNRAEFDIIHAGPTPDPALERF